MPLAAFVIWPNVVVGARHQCNAKSEGVLLGDEEQLHSNSDMQESIRHLF